jgi:hypothetical protein
LSYESIEDKDKKMYELAEKYFSDLSKEELIAKLINRELAKLLVSGNDDLNDHSKSEFKERRGDRGRNSRRSNKSSGRSSSSRGKSRRRSDDSKDNRSRPKKSKSSRRKKD